MTTHKPFKDLHFSDAFMFAAVMEDEDICRGVLERILGIPIKHVTVRSEVSLFINSDYRGVRLDVLANDESGTVFNVEMQITNLHNLPKRSRIYQGRMDLAALKPGQDFNLLPTSYVIFICTFDPFSHDYWRYTYDTRCRETGEELGDKAYKIFLNTKGSNIIKEPPELIRFLQYIENAVIPDHQTDSLIQQIETRLTAIKYDNSMEVQYMLFTEMLTDERKEGRQEGRQEGQKSILQLINSMTQNGDGDKVSLIAADPELLQKMCHKYHIIL